MMIGSEFYPKTENIEGEVIETTPKEFSVGFLGEDIYRKSSAFLISPELADRLEICPEVGKVVSQTEFNLREDWSIGREDSAYGVYFGELNLIVDGVDETRGHTIPVACKPFSMRERYRAAHEYSALSMFRGAPDLPTFNPLGIWVDEFNSPTLITEFEETVVSLDNIDWAHSIESPLNESFDVLYALQRAALTLGRLHGRGFAHGDAQIKNIAVDSRDSSIKLTDLTTLRRTYGRDVEASGGGLLNWSEGVRDDLVTLIRSVIRKGLGEDSSPQEIQDLLNIGLIHPHASMLRHPSVTHYYMQGGIDDELASIHQDINDMIGD